MPAFAESAGGLLTDKQIDVIVEQIRSRWGKPGILDGANPPAYAAKSAGDPERGQAAYKTYCESCHGSDGRGGPKGSAITDDSFLALVSDQGLRTIVIAGRPELGAPDWRGNVRGKPMSDQEVTDVVAWLASRRVEVPGQPYSAANSRSTRSRTMPNDTTLSRRGLFMKLGMLFNACVGAALAVPIGRFLLSSITRGRANGYLDWVSLGPVSRIPGGRNQAGYIPESSGDAD